ncbi:LLM class flavin-dependent oxidoreductase [Streptomyces sp. M19]
MLAPNHAPITVAEQFATLAGLHRAGLTSASGAARHVPRAHRPRAAPGRGPGHGRGVPPRRRGHARLPPYGGRLRALPEPWLLASSTAGAALAADLGCRSRSPTTSGPTTPSRRWSVTGRRSALGVVRDPRVLVCVETVCADTEERAAQLTGPMDVVKAGLLKGGARAVPHPATAAAHAFTAEDRRLLDAFRAHQAQGTPSRVGRALADIAEATGADELMLVTPVYDVADRTRSFELVRGLATTAATG